MEAECRTRPRGGRVWEGIRAGFGVFCFGGILNGKYNTKMVKSFYERF